MKTKSIAVLVAVGLWPTLGIAQPTPPIPAVPLVPPVPALSSSSEKDEDDDGGRAPKVPITFLGVETSAVPNVVAEQLGLAKGFGLVVDYVVADGPAAAAGLQQNDILKMLNEQILTEPDQLGKLIRSFPEGTSVTLTVLRKGAETKLTAKLGKREVRAPRGRNGWERQWRKGKGFGDLGPQFEQNMEQLTENLGNMNFRMLDENARDQIRDQAREAQREAREVARNVSREARQAARDAARAARDAAREFRVSRRDNGALKTTRIDMDKAQIVYHDAQGELKLENVAGKKVLTAKDPEGRSVFSGPVDTKEDLEKMPADVRQRFEKLEQKDLPGIAPNVTREERDKEAKEVDEDNDAEENDNSGDAVMQITNRCGGTPAAASAFDLNIVLI
ncbi:MAG: PDZ domain-containing protein [Chthoniobacterales bacterium]